MYRSSPLRSTLKTNDITGLRMCEVCTKAVHCVALWTRTLSQVWACVQRQKTRPKAKTRPAKKARNHVRGVFQGRRTSRFAGIYIYTYMFFISQSLQNYAAFGEKNEKDCSPESSNVLKASSPPPTNSGIKKNGIMHQQKCEKWSNTLPPINMKWKIGPSNSSYLSNTASFHFHDYDYGRKSKNSVSTKSHWSLCWSGVRTQTGFQSSH